MKKKNNTDITTTGPLPEEVVKHFDDMLLGKKKAYMLGDTTKITWLSEEQAKKIRRKDVFVKD